MTIHHDKLAYGKLASLTEEFSEDRLLEMVNSLSEENEESEEDAAVSGKKEKTAVKEKSRKKPQK